MVSVVNILTSPTSNQIALILQYIASDLMTQSVIYSLKLDKQQDKVLVI